MLIPNRFDSLDDYRYGFQGQEKDDEVKGEGNSLNYTFRMHDPRVGRFFARDPLEKYYPEQTPYQFSSNAPIHACELEGMETSHDLRFNRRERRYLSGEISEQQFREENIAEGKAGVVGGLIVAAFYTGGRTLPLIESLFYSTAIHFTRHQLTYIAAGNFAIVFLDEGNQIQTPGPIDDFGRSTKIVFGTFVKSKFTQKFTIAIGKLDFGLGRGSTVEKDLAKVTMKEIENMAKSLIRSKKIKEQGIDTSEKLLGLTSKALNEGVNEGVERITKHGTEFTKQIKLDDGTKVNVNFIIREKGAIPEVTGYSLPEVNKAELGKKIKELKDKAIDLGNKSITE
jgi:RHS repeat-associated protein